MIDIYLYRQTVDLFQDSLAHLGNTTMFNDKIRLYKNLDTPINFKIRNRDRVTQTPTTVAFTIFDSKKVKLLQTYLDFVEDGKYFTIVFGGGITEGLPTGKDYYFMLSTIDADTGNESPLYIDHDFGIHGHLWVEESQRPVLETVYNEYVEIERSLTNNRNFSGEKIIGRNFNQLLEMNKENYDRLYRISETFNIGEDDLSIGVRDTSDVVLPKAVYVLKHTNRHFPINTEIMNHWSLIQIHNDVMDSIKIDNLGIGHYMICVGGDTITEKIELYKKYI